MQTALDKFLYYIHHVGKPFDPETPPSEIRALDKLYLNREFERLELKKVPMATVEDRMIPMRDGASIPIRIYRPTEAETLPIIVYLHGGGFILKDIAAYDRVCRRIAKQCEAIVISVGYRLAPEYKFPIPTYDAYDATVWIAKNANSFGGDLDNFTIMGDSAGGNLATVTAIHARDKDFPNITKQVLVYPVTDARLQHTSMFQYGNGYFLTHEMMEWFIQHYQSAPEDVHHPMMSPLLHEDLTNLPPTFLITAELDPLKDEGKAYADKLQTAGNQVLFKAYKKVIHGFLNMPRLMEASTELVQDISIFLKKS